MEVRIREINETVLAFTVKTDFRFGRSLSFDRIAQIVSMVFNTAVAKQDGSGLATVRYLAWWGSVNPYRILTLNLHEIQGIKNPLLTDMGRNSHLPLTVFKFDNWHLSAEQDGGWKRDSETGIYSKSEKPDGWK